MARSTSAQIYEGKVDSAHPGTDDVLRLAKEAKREAANFGCDILIVDTAGRNQIDSALMDEMAALKKLLNPSEILFVADAMTGQDAVNSAKAFNDLLTITGSVLTKMDGDARGGAALSIRHITGAPIKFLGTGEKPDAFEPFHPDRIVSRIMGMGDIATLLERAEEKLDRGKAEQFARKALSGDGFSLEDFRDQLRQIKKMGSMKSIMKMLPSVGPFAGMAQAAENVDEGQLTRVESIINSMTNKERQDHEIINGSRRKRIANGSGTTVQDVNNLLRQYAQMRKMFKTMGGGWRDKGQRPKNDEPDAGAAEVRKVGNDALDPNDTRTMEDEIFSQYALRNIGYPILRDGIADPKIFWKPDNFRIVFVLKEGNDTKGTWSAKDDLRDFAANGGEVCYLGQSSMLVRMRSIHKI